MQTPFLSLARKWRPRSLDEVVGQRYVVRVLKNALIKGRLHHALLFTGTRGVGKTTLARVLAMLINCERPTINDESCTPCLTCRFCRGTIEDRLTDVIELDAASHTQVEKMRDLLESAIYAPVLAKFKVFIIDEVHMLSKSAFNAMLKTLEEPPLHVTFILATTDPQKLPATIRSRCLCFSLMPLTTDQISRQLENILSAEKIDYQNDAIQIVSRLANGSMRDALSILEQAIHHSDGAVSANDVRRITGDMNIELLAETLQAIHKPDPAHIQLLSERHNDEGVDFDTSLARLGEFFYKAALSKVLTRTTFDDEQETSLVREIAPLYDAETLQLLYEITLRGRQQLPLAPDAPTGFGMTLLRLMLFAPHQTTAQAAQALPSEAPRKPSPLPTDWRTTEAALDEPRKARTHQATQALPPEAPRKPNPLPTDWRTTEAELDETSKALTQHCIVKAYDANGVKLCLDKEFSGLRDRFLPGLTKALRASHGESFSVEVEIGTDDATAKKEALMSQAADIPLVQALLTARPQAKIIHIEAHRKAK